MTRKTPNDHLVITKARDFLFITFDGVSTHSKIGDYNRALRNTKNPAHIKLDGSPSRHFMKV